MSTTKNAVAQGTPGTSWLAQKGNLYALAVLAVVSLCSIWAFMADSRYVYMLVYVWFGMVYGMLLQYGRFCMAAAVRDLFAVGVPRMAVGMMIAVALYSIIAAVVTISGFSTFHPNAMGWHIIVGAFIFGFGIVFTGGCASGSLYKTGEGNMGSMIVVVAISFSQAIFVAASGWFDSWVPASWVASAADKGVPEELGVAGGWFDIFTAGYVWDLKGFTLADVMGISNPVVASFFVNTLLVSILPVFVVLIGLYAIYYRKGYLRKAKITNPSFGDHVSGMWSMFTSSKNTALAGMGLGIFAGMQMWVTGALRSHYEIDNFGELLEQMGHEAAAGLSMNGTVFDPGYWYITTQEAQWGAWVLEKLGFNMMDNIFFGLDNGIPTPLLNAPGFMSIGIILGAAVLALSRREFKWKIPSLETAIFAFIGGTLMGIGARIGMGCNIGAFFATVTNGDPSGWVFLFGMTLGGFVGVKAFNLWINRNAGKDDDFCDF